MVRRYGHSTLVSISSDAYLPFSRLTRPSALKRLMGRYANARGRNRPDAASYVVHRCSHGLEERVRASVEQYSLKALEVFHGFERTLPLEEARSAMRQMQHGLELGQATGVG